MIKTVLGILGKEMVVALIQATKAKDVLTLEQKVRKKEVSKKATAGWVSKRKKNTTITLTKYSDEKVKVLAQKLTQNNKWLTNK